jgi:hypothetical protein
MSLPQPEPGTPTRLSDQWELSTLFRRMSFPNFTVDHFATSNGHTYAHIILYSMHKRPSHIPNRQHLPQYSVFSELLAQGELDPRSKPRPFQTGFKKKGKPKPGRCSTGARLLSPSHLARSYPTSRGSGSKRLSGVLSLGTRCRLLNKAIPQ